jgi:UPF0716 protein FxsA
MWPLAAFIGIPLIEIALFILVGQWIGLWPTLFMVLFTAVLGAALVRSQGIDALRRVQESLSTPEGPAEPLAHGAMILLAGVFLVTPGFFTDFLGFALLIPGVRSRVFDFLRRRITLVSFGSFPNRDAGPADWQTQDGDIIDGEFEEIDPDQVPSRPSGRPSGWTRH